MSQGLFRGTVVHGFIAWTWASSHRSWFSSHRSCCWPEASSVRCAGRTARTTFSDGHVVAVRTAHSSVLGSHVAQDTRVLPYFLCCHICVDNAPNTTETPKKKKKKKRKKKECSCVPFSLY